MLERERTRPPDSWPHRGTRNLKSKQEPGSEKAPSLPVKTSPEHGRHIRDRVAPGLDGLSPRSITVYSGDVSPFSECFLGHH